MSAVDGETRRSEGAAWVCTVFFRLKMRQYMGAIVADPPSPQTFGRRRRRRRGEVMQQAVLPSSRKEHPFLRPLMYGGFSSPCVFSPATLLSRPIVYMNIHNPDTLLHFYILPPLETVTTSLSSILGAPSPQQQRQRHLTKQKRQPRADVGARRFETGDHHRTAAVSRDGAAAAVAGGAEASERVGHVPGSSQDGEFPFWLPGVC